ADAVVRLHVAPAAGGGDRRDAGDPGGGSQRLAGEAQPGAGTGGLGWRLAAYTVGVGVVGWGLWAHHVADLAGELTLMIRADGVFLLLALVIWLLYLALEPYFRR